MRALEDLKRRLAADRRCFAFFHPALPDEPLIFVEVALVGGMADTVQPLIDPEAPVGDPARPTPRSSTRSTTAWRACAGVTLGNFLIKLVVADLAQELPNSRPSPPCRRSRASATGCARRWAGPTNGALACADRQLSQALDAAGLADDPEPPERLRLPLSRLCAHISSREKRGGRPRDSVARFHLGNGARLERINWLGDLSPKGLAESFGLLVNYKYDDGNDRAEPRTLHQQWRVIMSSTVRALLPALAEQGSCGFA